ncbi:MAG: PqqD family protein [Caulobacter sp.]|nr:PqqD family protein [Caulobacter sp.]
MSADTGRFHVVAATSAVIWEQLDSPRTLGQLVAGLAARYDVGLGQCRDDVEEFVASLADRDLVSIQD